MRKLPPTLPVFLIVLVDVLGLTMLIPLLPFYAQTFGATEVQVGALMAVYAACSLVAGPPLGAPRAIVSTPPPSSETTSNLARPALTSFTTTC